MQKKIIDFAALPNGVTHFMLLDIAKPWLVKVRAL